jgi:PUA domain protein
MAPMRHLKDKESKQIIKDFTSKYPSSAESLSSVEHLEELIIEDAAVFFVDGKPWIIRTKRGLLPSLKFEAVLNTFPKVTVDMGAVSHIANGAQIMRPGIRKIEGQFAEHALIVILDEKYRKTIALGIADVNSDTMQSMTKGRVISNIHYVGDPLWNEFATAK